MKWQIDSEKNRKKREEIQRNESLHPRFSLTEEVAEIFEKWRRGEQ